MTLGVPESAGRSNGPGRGPTMSTGIRDVEDVAIRDLDEAHTWVRISLTGLADNATAEARRDAIYWLAKAEYHNVALRAHIEAEIPQPHNRKQDLKDAHSYAMYFQVLARDALKSLADNPTAETRQAAVDALADAESHHRKIRALIEKQ